MLARPRSVPRRPSGRPDTKRERLPPAVEARVLDARHEHDILDVAQTGGPEELDEMTFACAGELGFVLHTEAEVVAARQNVDTGVRPPA